MGEGRWINWQGVEREGSGSGDSAWRDGNARAGASGDGHEGRKKGGAGDHRYAEQRSGYEGHTDGFDVPKSKETYIHRIVAAVVSTVPGSP